MTACGECLLLLYETARWAYGKGLPIEEKEAGKRGQSLSSGIALDESNNDAEKRTASTEEQVLQKKSGMVDTAPQLEKVAGQHGGEDSILGPQGDSENLADEREAASVVLLCLSGTVEGHL